jgi:hypothetical protein
MFFVRVSIRLTVKSRFTQSLYLNLSSAKPMGSTALIHLWPTSARTRSELRLCLRHWRWGIQMGFNREFSFDYSVTRLCAGS